ncbi:hypothetical protein JTB14_016354 [Gonioctena quinquepunctata]|nr:hypothetical protein JTB14_016354 [Gonioctena quinquepunctata]
MISNYNRKSHAHGGVSIFARNDIRLKPINVEELCTDINAEFACCRLVKNGTVIVSTYRSPNGNSELYLNKLEALLEEKLSNNSKVIVVGDFNFNFKTNDNPVRDCRNIFSSYDLAEQVFTDTRVTETTSTRVDNLFTNLNTSTFILKVVEVNHSVKAVNSRFVCRPMTRKAIDNFKTEVLQTNWKLCHINIEDQAQNITNTLSDIYLRNFPEKEISVGGNSHITNIANTQKFKYLKSKLDAAQTMFKVTKSKASFELLRFLRKEYHAMINMEKVKLNNKYISESDIKKTAWNIINASLGRNKNRNKALSSDNCISADKFAQFFQDVIQNLIENSQTADNITMNFDDFTKKININHKSLYLHPTDAQEV